MLCGIFLQYMIWLGMSIKSLCWSIAGKTFFNLVCNFTSNRYKEYVSPVLFILYGLTQSSNIMKHLKKINRSAPLLIIAACTLMSSCTIQISRQTSESPEGPAPRYGLFVPDVRVSSYRESEERPQHSTIYGACTECACTHYVAKTAPRNCHCASVTCQCGHHVLKHQHN